MDRPPHILNAASSLLGIALILIAGLNVSHLAASTFADEIAWLAAVCLTLSCLFSYLALRTPRETRRYEQFADRVFLIGLLALFGAVLVLALFGGHSERSARAEAGISREPGLRRAP